MTLHLGDCLEVMKTLPDCSVDAVVTDPPYGLAFMGKRWDYDVPSVEIWAECLRVLKPGGHLLAFAGTRTQHRMAVRIEDAGFEIRDMIAWVYGCLDDQTQYASPDGPRPYHRAKVGDPVLCYNVETKEYSYQPIQDVYVYDYADTAYRLVGDHGVQVVSRNHRCLVERGGVEVFITAEEAAREQQARVPVLEDLPALRQALRNARQSPSGQEQDLRKGMRGGDDRQSQQHPYADRAAQADEGAVCGVRRRGAQSRFAAEARRCSDLQQAVQWSTAGAGVEEARQQGALTVEAGIRAGADRADDWAEQPSVEGRGHLSQPQGRLRQSADPLCPLPGAVTGDGSEGWLRDGAPLAGSPSDWPAADQGGSSPSRQPRRDGQPAGEPDAVCHQRPAQGIRAWSGHQTTVVRIEPFHYTGKVWCLKVPTGCFVAVRDGMAFPTGNSGFPKSLDVSKAIDRAAGAEREVVSKELHRNRSSVGGIMNTVEVPRYNTITAPATPEAQQWAGWGTALKPALEPITMARKPLTGTVAANVIQHGTGALNVDGCRVEAVEGRPLIISHGDGFGSGEHITAYGNGLSGSRHGGTTTTGRWPANLIHDGSDEPYGLLQDAARFFYTAKASKAERQGVTHPTVKPIELMAYLCRLVTPAGGTVLDPFMGSGTTIKAALSEGFNAIGIERDPAYFEMAQHRMDGAQMGLSL